ncbi:MAG: hypothetical protein NC936_02690 [Candidatus Omnitrophica bacterium]|nr:hypothetical protein [Candidatus Omnitrophota bacterium]
MRFYKFLFTAIFITTLCLAYVYQQTNIYRLAYTHQKKTQVYQDLLDKNNLLRYNVNVLTSLSFMGSKVLETADFELPATTKIVKLEYPQEKIIVAKDKLMEVLNLFGLKSQAEAKMIKH